MQRQLYIFWTNKHIQTHTIIAGLWDSIYIFTTLHHPNIMGLIVPTWQEETTYLLMPNIQANITSIHINDCIYTVASQSLRKYAKLSHSVNASGKTCVHSAIKHLCNWFLHYITVSVVNLTSVTLVFIVMTDASMARMCINHAYIRAIHCLLGLFRKHCRGV